LVARYDSGERRTHLKEGNRYMSRSNSSTRGRRVLPVLAVLVLVLLVLGLGFKVLYGIGLFLPGATINPDPTPAVLGDATGYTVYQGSPSAVSRTLTVDPDGIHATLGFSGSNEAGQCAVQYRPVGYVSEGELYVGIAEMPPDVPPDVHPLPCGGVAHDRTVRFLLPEPIAGSYWHVLQPPGSHF